jgi:hypothetical protein
MSERSERIIDTVLFAAQRRTAHWCSVEIEAVGHLHQSKVHQ